MLECVPDVPYYPYHFESHRNGITLIILFAIRLYAQRSGNDVWILVAPIEGLAQRTLAEPEGPCHPLTDHDRKLLQLPGQVVRIPACRRWVGDSRLPQLGVERVAFEQLDAQRAEESG